MITGVMTASHQAIIRLTVRGPEGQEAVFPGQPNVSCIVTCRLPVHFVLQNGIPLLFHHTSWHGANRIGNSLNHPDLIAPEAQR
jgi:hypothetical protein